MSGGRRTFDSFGGRRIIRLAMLLSVVPAPSVQAQDAPAGTRAGTVITNTAAVAFRDPDGQIHRATSNTVSFVVAERLDVVLEPQTQGMTQIDAVPVAVPLSLTNQGTGEEAFAITAGTSTPTTRVDGVAIDSNGDGRYDAGTDTMLTGATPPLAPGETIRLVAILAPAEGARPVDGSLTIDAQAQTGTGHATSYEGAGDDGGDAVVGDTGAEASATIPFIAARSGPTLAKSQSVLAPDGSANPVSGAVITYTLVAAFPASGNSRAVRLDDPVPAGTVYLPGTLTLDGAALTDAEDGDPGRVAGGTIGVTLGDIADASTRTIRFKVRIQ